MVRQFLFDDPLFERNGVFTHLHDANVSLAQVLRLFWREKGVLVTSTPYPEMLARLHRHGVRVDRMFFVDLASRPGKKKLLDDLNCVYAHPQNLAELKTILAGLAEQHGFVVVDSLAPLLQHHHVGQVYEFVRSLPQVFSQHKVHVFASQYHTPPELVDHLVGLSHGVSATRP